MTSQLVDLLHALNSPAIDIPEHLIARFIRALPNAGEYKYRLQEATSAGKSFAKQRKYNQTRTESTVKLRQQLELERILDDIKRQQELLKSLEVYEMLPNAAKNLDLRSLAEILL